MKAPPNLVHDHKYTFSAIITIQTGESVPLVSLSEGVSLEYLVRSLQRPEVFLRLF